ncbi:restriction endonuclease subunit S [Polaribacter sp. HaHaR_3_91]|uniref:restriction endonuclease subunit S n=1 Tax=Polaribacter sp. HaHaR_3_91 TaxID=2745561 RepID=UPI001C4FF6D7|nr:restriction endonuclease subunit S [Polaribacter sp. HaHaR_3_91]QXP63249.1 restriction endonuclease subunit S [Polaribacter sp. HaHaR_3_91]
MEKYIYKNSGIEWLGEIPEHWKVGKVKRGCQEIDTGKTPSTSEPKYFIDGTVEWYAPECFNETLWIDDPKKLINQTAVDDGQIKVYPANSVYFVAVGATAGKVGIISKPASCNQQINILQTNYKLLPEYLTYQFKLLETEIIKFAQYTTLPILNQAKTGNLIMSFPPLQEQKNIANYLDKATEKIDRVIAIKQEQLVKMENYYTNTITRFLTIGIENSKTERTNCFWLPKIKKGWKIKPLKRLLKSKLKYGANESAENENLDEPRYIRITDFGYDGKLRENTYKSLPMDKAANFLLKENDVLFARSGATVGKTFIFKGYEGIACFAGYLIKAECDKSKLLPEFLYYYTKSNNYEEWKNLIFTQATIQNIGADKYQYLNIPVPPINEQKIIVEKINDLNLKIEVTKNNINSQIKTLQAYRKSLIHECVTGKKQVTGK